LGRSWDLDKVAKFADALGPLNALLAGAAALAAFAALDAQKSENAALAKRAEADQQSTSRRDFENTFFRLVDLLRRTVEGTIITRPGSSKRYEGGEAFQAILKELGPSLKSDAEDKKRWLKIYNHYQAQLGHYFRLLYQVVKFVHNSDVNNKMDYIRALRATLSNAEIVLFGLNGWHGGYPKTKRFINDYALLHNITRGEGLSRRLNVAYNLSAFGGRDLALERGAVTRTE